MNHSNETSIMHLLLCTILLVLIHIAVNCSPVALSDGYNLQYFESLTRSDLIPLWVMAVLLTGYCLMEAIFSGKEKK